MFSFFMKTGFLTRVSVAWDYSSLDRFSVVSDAEAFLLTGLAVRYFKMVLRLLEAIFFLNFFLSNLVTAINTSIMVGPEGFEPTTFCV